MTVLYAYISKQTKDIIMFYANLIIMIIFNQTGYKLYSREKSPAASH